jgi:uncharacterized protein DUF2795
MERGSDKVSPRIDDELEHETESLQRGSPAPSRAQEFREQEAPAEGEPGPDARPNVGPAEARADLARHLQPSIFPADRARLLESAREMSAPDSMVSLLEEVPADRAFANVQEVWEALGLPEPRG